MTANIAIVWACVVSAIVLMGVLVVVKGVDGGVAVGWEWWWPWWLWERNQLRNAFQIVEMQYKYM